MTTEAAYYSPVDPALFGILSLILIGSGLSFMAMFFVYEMKVSHEHSSRSIITELSMATLSSTLLGFGTLFLTLWAGVFI
ncbi:nef1 [Nannochloropsis oceanica]